MKHTAQVTALLVLLFVVSQLVGLGLLAAGMDVTVNEQGEIEVVNQDTVLGERPQTEGGQSVLLILGAVAVGTIALLILAYFKLRRTWKVWFFLAVIITLTVSLGQLIPGMIAFAIALLLAIWKIYKPNPIIHNFTEILVYSGIGIVFIPILGVGWAALLLLVIAGYDAYAVWKSKHMISMAQFQSEAQVFAGLHLNYTKDKIVSLGKPGKKTAKKKEGGTQTAVLGGGDIAFPMIFIGAALQQLVRYGHSIGTAFLWSLAIVAVATASLAFLFYKAEKGKFYPAMPWLTTGCFAGYGLMMLLMFI